MKKDSQKKKQSKKKLHHKLPSSPVPKDWENLKPDPCVSLEDIFKSSEDTMALAVGNATYKELVRHAKDGDDKSFFSLIKMHTSAHPYSRDELTLLIPSIDVDLEFYKEAWVQKRLKIGMEKENFKKEFWKAILSRQNNSLYNRSATKLKRFISNRKTYWEEEKTTIEEIEKELIAKGFLKGFSYEDIDSFRRFLNRCGLSRPPGRPRGIKNRT